MNKKLYREKILKRKISSNDIEFEIDEMLK